MALFGVAILSSSRADSKVSFSKSLPQAIITEVLWSKHPFQS